MENVELVIKIPEAIRAILINCIQLTPDQKSMCEAYVSQAIINGTPLPKGHGRLIILSEDKLKENLLNFDFSCQKWISEVDISNATVAIIEADKEESEDKE